MPGSPCLPHTVLGICSGSRVIPHVQSSGWPLLPSRGGAQAPRCSLGIPTWESRRHVTWPVLSGDDPLSPSAGPFSFLQSRASLRTRNQKRELQETHVFRPDPQHAAPRPPHLPEHCLPALWAYSHWHFKPLRPSQLLLGPKQYTPDSSSGPQPLVPCSYSAVTCPKF